MSRNDELRALSERWNKAWNSHDVEKLVALVADDGTYYEPDLPGGPVDGKQGVRESAEKTWADWPDATFEARAIIVEDPRVALEWHSSAKHRSGVELQLEGVDLLEWKGDKVASARVYYDIHSRKRALGEK